MDHLSDRRDGVYDIIHLRCGFTMSDRQLPGASDRFDVGVDGPTEHGQVAFHFQYTGLLLSGDEQPAKLRQPR